MLEVLWWFDLVDALYINIGPWAGRSFFSFQRQMAGPPYNLRHFFYNFLLWKFQSELNSIPHLLKQIISKIGSRVLFKMHGDNPKKFLNLLPFPYHLSLFAGLKSGQCNCLKITSTKIYKIQKIYKMQFLSTYENLDLISIKKYLIKISFW
mgnify:CR=1 FL=1